jgi:heme exporter protein B
VKHLFCCTVMLAGHDFRQAFSQKNEFLLPLSFFIIAVLMFLLGIGPRSDVLVRMGGGLIWVLVLFASSLSLQRMFKGDFEDGTLEALLLASYPLEAFVISKIITHWVLCGLPIIILTPVAAACLHLSLTQTGFLIFTLSIGTPILSFIGAIGAALTLGSERTSFLTPLLVLPLYIPVLIFGASAVEAAFMGLSLKPYLFMLCGLFFLSMPLSLFMSAYSLNQSLKYL